MYYFGRHEKYANDMGITLLPLHKHSGNSKYSSNLVGLKYVNGGNVSKWH